MAYLGSKPQSGFISNAKERYTGITTAYVDLNHSIASLADVIVWVNFVKQDSTNLTLTSSTRITLGATLIASDIVEIAYLGKAVATQNPSTNSVTNDMLAGSIANSKLAGSIANDKLANSSITLNGSAVSLGGSATVGGDMTPAFSVVKTNSQSISNNSDTKVTFQTEVLDSNGAFASDRFTVPSGTADAKYFIFAQCYCNSGNNSDLKVASLNLFVNGSRQALSVFDARANQPRGVGMTISKILGLSASDYVEVYAKVDTDDAGITIDGGDSQTTFGGFKIIT